MIGVRTPPLFQCGAAGISDAKSPDRKHIFLSGIFSFSGLCQGNPLLRLCAGWQPKVRFLPRCGSLGNTTATGFAGSCPQALPVACSGQGFSPVIEYFRSIEGVSSGSMDETDTYTGRYAIEDVLKMSYFYGTFRTPHFLKKQHEQKIYDISEAVSNFFWDDAPLRYGLEVREGQQDMAFEILDALRREQHITVEAGVGIGKSFAYLVPLLLYNQKTGLPVAIATSTIALQEQLLKDVARLKPLLGVDPEVTLAKGQTHYICLQRAAAFFASRQGQPLSEMQAQIDGGCQDRRAFPTPVPGHIWDKINVVRYNRRTCFQCPHREQCQYYALRCTLHVTDGVILCNQDLLTAHLFRMSRNQEGLLNSELQLIVVDEAHNLETKVRSATTERYGPRQLLGLINAATQSLRGEQREYVQAKATAASQAVHQLYDGLARQVEHQIAASRQDMKYAERFFFQDTERALEKLRALSTHLQNYSDAVQLYSSMDSRQHDGPSAADDLEAAAQAFSYLVSELDKRLIWLERKGTSTDLVFCPKNTRDIISRLYFRGGVQSIMTSATLTSAMDGELEDQYAYYLQNTGFPVGDTGILSEPKPSPFPYNEHALIYYCQDLPHPTREHDAFIRDGVERLVQLLQITHGKALVLFTAKTDMEEVYAALQARELPFQILIQQDGSSQERVLDAFQKDTDSVLLGTGSYWEGISIEGKALSHVVIFRLPFPVPDPIISYKASISKDPLMEVQVPEMIIKLKQGIGRLIRNFTDTGIVSIIDSRLRDDPPKRYHDVVWHALPIQNRTTELDTVRTFFEAISRGASD